MTRMNEPATIASLVTSFGALIAAIISFRKDKREERAEPITESTAILTQQRGLVDTAIEMAKLAQTETAAARTEAQAARAEAYAAYKTASQAKEEATRAKQTSEKWYSWYRMLVDRWHEVRGWDNPPPPPEQT